MSQRKKSFEPQVERLEARETPSRFGGSSATAVAVAVAVASSSSNHHHHGCCSMGSRHCCRPM